MDSDLPLACSLDAGQLSERLAQISAIGRDALIDAHTAPGQAVLRFGAGLRARERLEEIVAAEARCCAFLRFELTDRPGAIVMRIHAPAGAELVLDELVAAFTPRGRVTA